MIKDKKRSLAQVLIGSVFTIILGISCTQNRPERTYIPESKPAHSDSVVVSDFNVVNEIDSSAIVLKTTEANITFESMSLGADSGIMSFYTPSHFSDVIEDGETVWLSSDAGLLHWNLETGDLRHFLAPQTPLPDNHIGSMTERAGKLYMATRTGVAIFDKQSEWEVFTNEEIGAEWGYGRPSAWIGNELWVGSDNGISVLSAGGSWRNIDTSEFPFTHIRKIEEKDGGAYVGIHDGNWSNLQETTLLFKDNEWSDLGPPEKSDWIDHNGVRWQIVEADGDNPYEDVLINSFDNGESWQQILHHDTFLKINKITDSGKVYLDGQGSLFVFENDQIDAYVYTEIGPEVNFINHIVVDEKNTIWIGTDGRGLSGFDGERWQNWQPEFRADMRGDAIRGLAVHGGFVYAGEFGSAASGGLMIYDVTNDAWVNHWPITSGACPSLHPEGTDPNIGREYERKNHQACEFMTIGNISAGGVGAITTDSLGNAYFANAEGYLDIYSAETRSWKTLSITLPGGQSESDEDLPFKVVSLSAGARDAIESQNGDILIGTGSGIFRFDGTTFELVYRGGVKSIMEDQNGTIWGGSSAGLVQINSNGTVQVFDETNSDLPESHRLTDIALGPDGKIWGAGFNVFFSFDGEKWNIIDHTQFGDNHWGDSLAFDSEGNLWVESYDGLMQFPQSELP